MDLAGIAGLEAAWVGRVTPPPGCFGWEPYDPRLFAGLLAACLPHVPAGNRAFLDAGCGIGTKCLLAQRAGLAAHGIDLVPEFLAEAARLGVSAELADARAYGGYGSFGLVYVNHPLACGPGCDDEAALEQRIHEAMAPGAVLLSVNCDLAPGCAAHKPGTPCTDACPHDAAAWPQITRAGAWAAAWVKPGA